MSSTKRAESIANRVGIPDDYKPLMYALMLTGIYAVLAGGYIWFSSTSAAQQAISVSQLQESELTKGSLFVLVSAGLLYAGSFSLFSRMWNSRKKITRLQQRLIEEERNMVTLQLTKILAHDMNNALTVIMNCAELISRESGTSREKRIVRLRHAAEQLTGMISELQEAGEQNSHLPMEKVRIETVLRDLALLSRTHPTVSGCAVAYSQRELPPVFHGYPNALKRALFNLLLNAAEATEGQGTIEVVCDSDDDQVVIEVHDDGPGISEHTQEKIFQPFFTTKSDGTGVGLLSVQSCVEAHNGELTLCESRLGGGGFRMTLPRSVSHHQISRAG